GPCCAAYPPLATESDTGSPDFTTLADGHNDFPTGRGWRQTLSGLVGPTRPVIGGSFGLGIVGGAGVGGGAAGSSGGMPGCGGMPSGRGGVGAGCPGGRDD